MKKWLTPVIVLVLIVSLGVNFYQFKQNHTRSHAQYMLQKASAFLWTAAQMPIMKNTPNNSTQERGANVASAAAYLDSAAPLLDDLGVHHMQGIAMTLSQYSFPMMYPNLNFPNQDPKQMLSFVRFTYAQFKSSGVADTLDVNKLQAVINKIYQAMPAKTRQLAYDDYVVKN